MIATAFVSPSSFGPSVLKTRTSWAPLNHSSFTCRQADVRYWKTTTTTGRRSCRRNSRRNIHRNNNTFVEEPRERGGDSKQLTIRATGVPVEVTEDTFESEVLKADVPVLVDFYAAWCGPCKLVSPLMDWAAAEYDGQLKVCKVDTEVNESFVKQYGIAGLPTFAVFLSGEATGITEGAMGKPSLQKYIAKHVPGMASA